MLQSLTVLCPDCGKKLQAIKRHERWYSWCFDCNEEHEIFMPTGGTLGNLDE